MQQMTTLSIHALSVRLFLCGAPQKSEKKGLESPKLRGRFIISHAN